MSKVSNVLLMLEYLSNNRKYSIKELAEKLEVSPRMIRVYKDELEKAGIYIDTIKGPYGGYVLNQNIYFPKRFTNIKIADVDKKIFNKINKALKEKKKCFIEYYNKDKSSTTKRIIEPMELVLTDGDWTVVSFCELRKDVRVFYLKRIKIVEIIKN